MKGPVNKNYFVILFFSFAVLALAAIAVFINGSGIYVPTPSAPPAHVTKGPGMTDGEREELLERLSESDSKIAELQDKIDQLIGHEQQSKIIKELIKALSPYGVSLKKSQVTGDISLDAAILFPSNDDRLTSEGEDFLNTVFPVFVSVLTDSENIGEVKEINIIGHINPTGEISDIYRLSLLRALAVSRYISAQGYSAITSEQRELLLPLLNVGGASYSRPVYTDNGTIDDVASKRVEISFAFREKFNDEEILKIIEENPNA